jgi:predicted ATPase
MRRWLPLARSSVIPRRRFLCSNWKTWRCDLASGLWPARAGHWAGCLRAASQTPETIKGLYIWGSVGRGKTMLMDMFFARATGVSKRRAHFHVFMADVHERIHAFRQRVKAGEIKDGDPIAPVARAIAAEASLLCFDEFTVTDIADAMILARLFHVLFAEGVTLVATSNVEPSRLYEGGLNRTLFLPFIQQLGCPCGRRDAGCAHRLQAGETCRGCGLPPATWP